jgi:hypothetical protein
MDNYHRLLIKTNKISIGEMMFSINNVFALLKYEFNNTLENKEEILEGYEGIFKECGEYRNIYN